MKNNLIGLVAILTLAYGDCTWAEELGNQSDIWKLFESPKFAESRNNEELRAYRCKIKELLKAIEHNPYQGIGSPEAIKYKYDRDTYSRSISNSGRMVYVVNSEKKEIYLAYIDMRHYRKNTYPSIDSSYEEEGHGKYKEINLSDIECETDTTNTLKRTMSRSSSFLSLKNFGSNSDINELISGRTLLMDAASNGNLEKVKKAIKKGAKIDVQNKKGQTALMFAAREGHLEIVKYLVEMERNPDAKEGKIPVIKQTDDEGKTPLIYAVECTVPSLKRKESTSALTTVQFLLQNGADANETDKFGKTALIYAIESETYDGTKDLIEAGANVNAVYKNKTALIYAAERKNLQIIRLLINAEEMDFSVANQGEVALSIAQNLNSSILGELKRAMKKSSIAKSDTTKSESDTSYTLGNSSTEAVSDRDESFPENSSVGSVSDRDESFASAGELTDGTMEIVSYADDEKSENASIKSINTEAPVAIPESDVQQWFGVLDKKGEKRNLIKEWMEKYPDIVYLRDKRGRTSLMRLISAHNNDGTSLAYLLNQIRDPGKKAKLVNQKDYVGKTALQYAIWNNDSPSFSILIKHGAEVSVGLREMSNSINKTGWFNCAKIGNTEKIKEYLDRGQDIEEKDINGLTALMYAAQNRVSSGLHCLLERGADVEAVSTIGKTALVYAIEAGSFQSISTLLRNNSSINEEQRTKLLNILEQEISQIKVIQKILESVELQQKALPESKERNLAVKGSVELQQKVLPESKERNLAVKGSVEFQQKVLPESNNKGENSVPNLQDLIYINLQELIYHIKNRKIERVKYWLKGRNQYINFQDQEGRTPLIYAVWYSDPSVVACIADVDGININIQDHDGKTALMYAVENRDINSVRILLNRNARIDLKNKEGKTALDIAKINNFNEGVTAIENEGWFKCVQLGKLKKIKWFVEEIKQNINAKDEFGKTALMYSVINDDASNTLNYLIEKGADVNIADNEGKTALWYAVISKTPNAVKVLIKKGARVSQEMIDSVQSGEQKLSQKWDKLLRMLKSALKNQSERPT